MTLSSDQQKLVVENYNLIYSVLNRIYLPSIPWLDKDDLIQVGAEGLCLAASSYDPSKAKFSTYAYNIIYHRMCNCVSFATNKQVHEYPKTSSPENDTNLIEELPDTQNTIDAMCLGVAFNQSLSEISTRSRKHRTGARILYLMVCENKSREQIVKLINRSLPNYYASLHAARSELKNMLVS